MPGENVSSTETNVTPNTDELWHCKKGCIEYDSQSMSSQLDGIPLPAGCNVIMLANTEVFYRATQKDTVLVRFPR